MTQTSRKSGQAEEDKLPLATREKENVRQRLRVAVRRLYQHRTVLVCAQCVVILSLALGLNLYRLGDPSIWFDEALSVTRARQSLPVLLQIVSHTQPNMALYYFFLHYWLSFTSLFGLNPTEFVVRFPSAIFAALSSVVVFLLGRRFLGITAGILGAALYVFNSLQLVYAQETRSYALQLLLICIGWYALFAALSAESCQKRWWVCYVVAMTLAVYAHLFSLFILLAQCIALGAIIILPGAWRSNIRRRLPAVMVSLLSLGILIIPMLIASRVGSKTGWLPVPRPYDLYLLFLVIADDSTIYLLLIAALMLLGLTIALLVYLPSGKRLLSRFSLASGADDQRLSRLQQLLPVGVALLCWLIVPVVVSYVISQKSTHLFSSRYLVTIVPPLFLLVGMGVSVLRWRAVQLALGVGLVLIALHHVPYYYQTAQVETWSPAAHWLEQHYRQGDGIVCYDNSQGCQVSIEYYLDAYPSAAHFDADAPGSFPWVSYDITNRLGNYRAAVDPKALQAYGAEHPRLFFIAGRLVPGDTHAHAAEQWLDSHYHFIGQIVTPTVTIRLYATIRS